MPTIDWNEVPDADEQGYTNNVLLPKGEYEIEVEKVFVKAASAGKAETWWLKLKVLSGQHEGCTFLDSLAWCQPTTDGHRKALQRCKLVFSRLGIATSGLTEVYAQDLVGRKALVDVFVDTYEGKERNKVPFAGWKKHPMTLALESEPTPF